ncbi:MAG: phytanoyl-CoA dioxygenase family protein [Woeseia sp.]
MQARLFTAGIAVETATKANGCLQLIPGSHRFGRMRYVDTQCFESRVKHAKETLGLVHCEMDAGDAVFFHCNTLHGSSSNETDTSRLMLFASYNAVSNQPIPGAQGDNADGKFMSITAQERTYRPLIRIPDDVLSKQGFRSAFGHRHFKIPTTELDETYTQAVEVT